MNLLLLFTFHTFKFTFSCMSWSYDGATGPLFGMGKKDHKLYRDLNHWTPGYWTRWNWENWYKNWVYQQAELKKSDKKAVSDGWTDYDHTNKPRRWTHFPPGRDAQAPPPWAVIPGSYGKPNFCFDPPNIGNCDQPTKRWGFNPYAGACQKFTYTGCGGNSNNFLNKRRCEEACLKLASSLCLKYGTRRDGTALEGEPC